MVEERQPIDVTYALRQLLDAAGDGMQEETLPIDETDGRKLAESIYATHPIPNFDKSPYDGFALRSADTKGATPDQPSSHQVVEHIGAGELPEITLGPNEATRIMTGATIPDGADCVVMFEKCTQTSHGNADYIQLDHVMESGDNIIRTGSELEEDSLLIASGTQINPGVKALLATFGYARVRVEKKPLVGIVATGTELLEVDQPLEPGKIRNSNAYMIASQVMRAGATYKYFGKLDDELESSYTMIKNALEEADILITTGGVSVGDYDLMPAIYDKLGADVLFNKVKMRPGSVTTVARKGNQFLFGLSGNPSACYVGFELFTRTIIQKFLGNSTPFLTKAKARLAEDFPKHNPFTRFVRSYITYETDGLSVHLAGIDKSNVVSSLAFTSCLMMLPADTGAHREGDMVDVLLLDDANGSQGL